MKVKIEKLIKIGKENYKTQKYIDSEYFIIYKEAVDFLIENYKLSTEIEINKIFKNKIPKLFNNKECENVFKEFENLKSNDLSIRLKSSKFFKQKALNTVNGYRAIIFKRPDTFEQLITALKNEKEDKIIINLIITIGGAYRNYFEYFRTYEILSDYILHRKSEIRYYAIIWTRGMQNKQRIQLIRKLYTTEKSKKIRKIIEEENETKINNKEIIKYISTINKETDFQVRFSENEGVGLLTTRNNLNYFVLDSLDYWYDIIQDKYPQKKKCSCKNDWFKIIFIYTKRTDCDDIKRINIFTNCTNCEKSSEAMSIDIDYSPTDKLLSEPISFCENPKIMTK